MMRRFVAAVVATVAFLAAGCAASTDHRTTRVAASSGPPLPPEPRTASALLKIATTFNDRYDNGDYGPVYDRWDARSQAIITRDQYIERHEECPGAIHTPSLTESAYPGPHGARLVHYEIGGQQLTDYWFYIHRDWRFDLVLSNPDSVRLPDDPAAVRNSDRLFTLTRCRGAARAVQVRLPASGSSWR